jgi:hypothetical protein
MYHSVLNILSSGVIYQIKAYKTIVLAVALYGCETWYPIVRDDYKPRLRLFENRMLRRKILVRNRKWKRHLEIYTKFGG